MPFAASEGGLVFHIVGTAMITMWNIYSVHCLVQSRAYIQAYEEGAPHTGTEVREESNRYQKPPERTSTFGQVAWYAFGSVGLHIIDALLIMLMLGIIVAYEGTTIYNATR